MARDVLEGHSARHHDPHHHHYHHHHYRHLAMGFMIRGIQRMNAFYIVVDMNPKEMLSVQWEGDVRLGLGQKSGSRLSRPLHCGGRCAPDQRCSEPATCWAALAFLLTWVRCWKVSGHSRLLCDIWPGKPDAVLGSGSASRGKRRQRTIEYSTIRRVPMPDTGSETDSPVAHFAIRRRGGGQPRASCSVPVDPLIGESWCDACGMMYLYRCTCRPTDLPYTVLREVRMALVAACA
jgi:hypothetical protein